MAEEENQRPARTLVHLLAQTPRHLIDSPGRRLAARDIAYGITGATAASLIAPYATAIPVVDIWVEKAVSARELLEASRFEAVTEGHNVVFLQTKADTALVFRKKMQHLWLTNRLQTYLDLRRDPRRGREQADHFRGEVIGF